MFKLLAVGTRCYSCPHPLQAFTLIIWAAGRFFLYSSYFAIFGALFGFKNFGRMVAIDNTFNGLIGILQLPLAWWGVGGLRGNFTLINCLQVRASLRGILDCMLVREPAALSWPW